MNDIAKAAGLSRRVLEKRFRASLSRSVNAQVRQCRIQLISAMLMDTSMTISEIAMSMGFPDAAHIARYFRSQTNMSPSEFRSRCGN